jgi:hypothetical protein
MTTSSMNDDDDRPATLGELKATRGELKATRAELKAEISNLRTELVGAIHHVVETLGARMETMRADVRADMEALRVEVRADMEAMRLDLSRELARHVTASAEQTQRLIMGLDDRYRDLPGRVAVLERKLDEHRRDTGLHPPRRRR